MCFIQQINDIGFLNLSLWCVPFLTKWGQFCCNPHMFMYLLTLILLILFTKARESFILYSILASALHCTSITNVGLSGDIKCSYEKLLPASIWHRNMQIVAMENYPQRHITQKHADCIYENQSDQIDKLKKWFRWQSSQDTTN